MINSLNSNSYLDNFTIKKIHGNTVRIFHDDRVSLLRGKKFEINLKIVGLDESVSEKDMKDFKSFMQKNMLKDPNKIEKSPLKNLGEERKEWDPTVERMMLSFFVSYSKMFHLGRDIIEKANEFYKEFDGLIRENLSLDEFKTKYMDFKQRHDEFVKEYEIAMGDKMLIHDDETTTTDNSVMQKTQESATFKPIQGESKNKETYKDNNIRHEFLKKLLKNSFNQAKELEILLGMKMSDDENFDNFLLKKNLQSVKSVDIKV